MVAFLNDPTGDKPWEEEQGSEDVLHLDTEKVTKKFRKLVRYVALSFT